MKPGLIYSAAWQTFQGDLVEVRISDRTIQIDDAAAPQMVVLQASGDPLHVKVIDNSENPLNVFRAKQAIFAFQSQPGLSAGSFADGPDDRYSFTATLNPTGSSPQIIFDGFLVTSDLSQPFQPDSQVVTLTASDHLGLLKETDVTTDTGDQFIGKYKLIQYIAAILKKTGLRLPIKVINNVKVGGGSITSNAVFFAPNLIAVTASNFYYKGMRIRVSGSASNDGEYTVTDTSVTVAQFLAVQNGPTITAESATGILIEDLASEKHLYDAIFVDALLFEKGIGAKVDGYEGLTKIFKENVCITEVKGEWWIYAPDEYDRDELYVSSFDADGIYQSRETTTALNKLLGAGQDHQFALADTELRFQRPHGFASETYRFEYPEEIPCNSDFSRGEAAEDLPDVTIEGITYTAKAFTIDCWEYAQHRNAGRPTDPATGNARIVRYYYNGQEQQRFIRLDGKIIPGSGGEVNSLKSQPLAVNKQDKITFSISTRWNFYDFADGEIAYPLSVELEADDGTYWALYEPNADGKGIWGLIDATGPQESILGPQLNENSLDATQWNSKNVESAGLPRSGNLYFYLRYDYSDDTDYQDFSDLRIEYLTFINGAYRSYGGLVYKVTRPLDQPGYLARKEEEVYMGNPPAPVIKGAMFIQTDGRNWLVDHFYKAHRFGLGPAPTPADVNTFGFHQAFAAWNQVRNTVRIFSGTVFGMRENWPDIIHKYQLTDANGNTNGRYFILTSLDQNWRSCQMAVTLIEVFVTDGKIYTDPYTLNYTTT